ncbi:uncharacterized protein [Amphiura filiformis]|uniref:uncharacterized protein n=1 Tax=Amphiura filiformis TaxID=82378 RepID=UPI003B216D11
MLPSDIARLVLGYLHDEGLEATSRAFLIESPHLEELRQNPSSSILRPSTKSLIATLEEYEDIKDNEKRKNAPDKVLNGLWRKFDSALSQIKYKYQPSENSLEAQTKRSRQKLVILRQQQGPPGSNIVLQPKIQGQLIIPNTSTPITIVTTPKKSQVVTPLANPVTQLPIPYTTTQIVIPNVSPAASTETTTDFTTNPTLITSPGSKPVFSRIPQQISQNSVDNVGSVLESGVVHRQRRDSGSSINSGFSASDVDYSQLSPLKQGQDKRQFKSPKRKSGAPKRKPARIPTDHQKKPDPPPPPPGLTPTEQELEETRRDLPQVLETLLSNRELQQRLAGNINKALPTGAQKQDLGVPASPQDPSVGLSLSIDDILNTQMSEDTVTEIIDNTSHDPAFESLFSLFNVDKDQYMEQQREELEKRKKENDQSISSESDFAEPMETDSVHRHSLTNTNSVPPMAIYGKSPTESDLASDANKSKMSSTSQNAPSLSTVLHISEDSQIVMEPVVLPSLDGSEPQIMSPVSFTAPSPAPMQQTSVANVMPDPPISTSYTSRSGCMVPPKKRQIGLRMENHQGSKPGSVAFKTPENKTSTFTSQQANPLGNENSKSSVIITPSPSKNKLSNPYKSVVDSDAALPVQSPESVEKPSTSCTINDINKIIAQAKEKRDINELLPSKEQRTSHTENTIAQAKRDLFNPKSPSKPVTEMPPSKEQRTSRARSRKSGTQPRRFSGRKTKSPERFSPCTTSKSRQRVVSPEKEPDQSLDTQEPVGHDTKSTKPKASRSKTPKKVEQVSEQLKSSVKSTASPSKLTTKLPKSDYSTPEKADKQPLSLEVRQPHDAESFMAALQMSPSGAKAKSGTNIPSLPSEHHSRDTSEMVNPEMHLTSRTPVKAVNERDQQMRSPQICRSPRTPGKSPNKRVAHPSTPHRDGTVDSSSEASVETPVFVPTNVHQSEDSVDLYSEPNTPQMQIISQPNTPLAQALMSPGHASTPVPLTLQVGETVEVETTEMEHTAADDNSLASVITVDSQDSQGSVEVVSNECVEQGIDDNVPVGMGRTETTQVVDKSNVNVVETSCRTSSEHVEPSALHTSKETETVEVEFVVEETGENVDVNAEALTEGINLTPCNMMEVAHNKETVSEDREISITTKTLQSDPVETPPSLITSEQVTVDETEQPLVCEPSVSNTKPSQVSENTSAMLPYDSSGDEPMDLSKPEHTLSTKHTDLSKPEQRISTTKSVPTQQSVTEESVVKSTEMESTVSTTVIESLESVKSPEIAIESTVISTTVEQVPEQKVESNVLTSIKTPEKSLQVEEESQVDRPGETSDSSEKSIVSHGAMPIEVQDKLMSPRRRHAVVTVPVVISSGDELEPTAILQAPVLLPHVKTPAKGQGMNVSEDMQDSIKPMQALLKVMSPGGDATAAGTLPHAVTSSQLPMQLVHSKLNVNPGASKVRRILPKRIGPPGVTIVTSSISNTPIFSSVSNVFATTLTTSRTSHLPNGGHDDDSHIGVTPKKTEPIEMVTPRQAKQPVVVAGKHSAGKSSNTRPPLRRFVKTDSPLIISGTPQSHSKRGMIMRSLDIGGNATEATTPKVFSVPRRGKGGYVVRTLDCQQTGSAGDQTPKSSVSKSNASPKEQGYNMAKSKPNVSPLHHEQLFERPALSTISYTPGQSQDKSEQITPRKRTPRKQDLSAAVSRDFEATVDLAAEVLASCSPRKTPIKQGRRSSGGNSAEIGQTAESLFSLSTSPQSCFTAIQSASVLRNVMNAPKRNLMAEQEKAKTTKDSNASTQGKPEEKKRGRGRPRLKDRIQGAQTASVNQGQSRKELPNKTGTVQDHAMRAPMTSDNQTPFRKEQLPSRTLGTVQDHATGAEMVSGSQILSRKEQLPNRTSDHATGTQMPSGSQLSSKKEQVPNRTSDHAIPSRKEQLPNRTLGTVRDLETGSQMATGSQLSKKEQVLKRTSDQAAGTQMISGNQVLSRKEQVPNRTMRTLQDHATEAQMSSDNKPPSRKEQLPNRTSGMVQDHTTGAQMTSDSSDQVSSRSQQLQKRTLETEKCDNPATETNSKHIESSNIPKINGDMNIPHAEETLTGTPGTSEEGATGDTGTKPKKQIKAKKRRREDGSSDQPEMKKAKKSKLKRKSFPTNMDVDKFLAQLQYPQ